LRPSQQKQQTTLNYLKKTRETAKKYKEKQLRIERGFNSVQSHTQAGNQRQSQIKREK